MAINMNSDFITVEASDSMILFRGEPGGDGPQGPAGPAATVNIGTTTTLPAGSNATVTNSGTDKFAILNFGIPRGIDGEGAPVWGTITGDIDDQTDLQNALSAKADTADLGTLAFEDDVPEDNNYYFRRNLNWVKYNGVFRKSVEVYVDSANGSDDNKGTGGFDYAFKTLEKAYSLAPDFGKLVIRMNPGSYTAPAATLENKYEINIKLHGNVTIDHLFFNNCKSIVIEDYSLTHYTLTINAIYLYDYTYLRIDTNLVINATGNIERSIYATRNCELITGSIDLDVTSSNANYKAIFLDGMSNAYFGNLDLTISAGTGISVNRGSVVAYGTLTGSMPTQTATSNGGRIYTGSQS